MSTPLIFKSIALRNFLSFGNNVTEIDLSNPGSVLIQGENVDTGSANGAGKTTIINAICYAFYNKPFDNISLQRLINSTNSIKNTLMEVRMSFQKADDEYEIYRCRGEVTNIQITCNGEDITLDSVSENDKRIEEIIGISYDLFTKIIIFSGNSTPFLMLPVAQQRLQIEELFNITLLTEKAVKLKEIIRTTENDISVQEAVVKEQEAAIARYSKQLVDAEARVTRWENDRIAQVEKLTQQLESLSNVDMDAERAAHALISENSKLLADTNASLALLRKDESATNSDIKKLDGELTHLLEDKCPYCLQAYEGAGDKLVEKKKKRDEKVNKSNELATTITEVTSIKQQIENDVVVLKEQIKFKSITEAIETQNSAQTAQQRIDEMIAAKNPHVEAHDDLLHHAVATVSYDKIDELRKNLEHQQFLLKLLTDKNSFIRRKIINRTIPFLNSRLVEYTQQLGLPHVVKFDDDMSCTVSEFGREFDFGNLSSGEKKRVNLSLSLAFRDVLHHLHARANCLFIDEIDASLDAIGVEAAFKLLKAKTRDDKLGLWIISHRPESVGRFDRTLTIRKENGFSKLVDASGQEVSSV